MAEYLENAKELQDALSPFFRMPKKPPFLQDLSYGEMAVFAGLIRLSKSQEQVKMADLSRDLDMSKPGLSQLVNRLEDKELVERVYSKADRRATFLAFTEKGRRIFEVNSNHMMAMMNTLVEKMGQEDTAVFIELLNKLFSIFEESMREHPCAKEKCECQNY